MINRDQIRKVKRYDNSEFKRFLKRYSQGQYEQGYIAGIEKGSEISSQVDYMETLIKVLDNTKGIGKKRKDAILDGMIKEFKKD